MGEPVRIRLYFALRPNLITFLVMYLVLVMRVYIIQHLTMFMEQLSVLVDMYCIGQ